jgi:2-oxo-4-hydroxy-4-carboxy--5-ureidoimidazoline (OHCU) decarboxylase
MTDPYHGVKTTGIMILAMIFAPLLPMLIPALTVTGATGETTTILSGKYILSRLPMIIGKMIRGTGSVFKTMGNVDTSRLMEQIEKFPRPLTEVGRIMIEMTSDLSERQKLTIAVLCLFAILAKAYKSSHQKKPTAITGVLEDYKHETWIIERVIDGENSADDNFQKKSRIEDLITQLLKHVQTKMREDMSPKLEAVKRVNPAQLKTLSNIEAVKHMTSAQCAKMFVQNFVHYLSFVFLFKTWNNETALQREVDRNKTSSSDDQSIQHYIIETYIPDIRGKTPTTPTTPTSMPDSFITLCFCDVDVYADNIERLLEYLVTNISKIHFNHANIPNVVSPEWGPTTIYTSAEAMRFRPNALENDPSPPPVNLTNIPKGRIRTCNGSSCSCSHKCKE